MPFAGDGSSGYGGRSIEKEKEKKKPQTFLLRSVCAPVEIGRQNSVLGEGREKNARERTNLLTCAGCGLHHKVKKLSTEMWGTVLRYWSQTKIFSFGFGVRFSISDASNEPKSYSVGWTTINAMNPTAAAYLGT